MSLTFKILSRDEELFYQDFLKMFEMSITEQKDNKKWSKEDIIILFFQKIPDLAQ